MEVLDAEVLAKVEFSRSQVSRWPRGLGQNDVGRIERSDAPASTGWDVVLEIQCGASTRRQRRHS